MRFRLCPLVVLISLVAVYSCPAAVLTETDYDAQANLTVCHNGPTAPASPAGTITGDAYIADGVLYVPATDGYSGVRYGITDATWRGAEYYFNLTNNVDWGVNTILARVIRNGTDNAIHAVLTTANKVDNYSNKDGIMFACENQRMFLHLNYDWAATAMYLWGQQIVPGAEYLVGCSWRDNGSNLDMTVYCRQIGDFSGGTTNFSQGNRTSTGYPRDYNNHYMYIGRRGQGSGPWDGSIDWVRISDTFTASQAEYDAIYQDLVGDDLNCAAVWELGYGNEADLNQDCYVNFDDLSTLADNWLRCIDPRQALCEHYEGYGRVIHTGWPTPDVPWLCAHVESVEAAPYHGLSIYPGRRDWIGDCMTRYIWSMNAIPQNILDQTAQDKALLEQTQFKRFKENMFYWVNTGVSNLPDWFDPEFDSVIDRMAGAGQFIYDCQMGGILFDPEYYSGNNPWIWREQKYYNNPYTFEQYEAQVRLRARQIAAAMKAACPRQFTWLFLIATSNAYQETQSKPLYACYYGLLPAFVEGLLDEAVASSGPDPIIVIDGNESAYGCYTSGCFNWVINRFIESASISTDPTRYLAKVQMGFGTMMDYQRVEHGGWHSDPAEFELNYYSPSRFQSAMQLSADNGTLTWVYTEIPNWWDGSLHEDYVNALRAITGLPGPSDCAEAIGTFGMTLAYDLNGDCYVSVYELAAVVSDWLRCNEPHDARCEHPWQ